MRRALGCALVAAVALAGLSGLPARAGAARPSDVPISFLAPIDFATGATPSSAALNQAAGDQLALTLAHAPLSDGVVVGDFNRDGRPDVAQTNVVAGTLSVFLGKGAARFGPPDTYRVGVHPTFVTVGDLDADRNLDLVVANTGSGNLAILRGSPSGAFGSPSFIPVPAPRNVAIGNFNGDRIPDLAVASNGAGAGPNISPVGGVVLFTGSADATFDFAQLVTLRSAGNGLPIGANYVAGGDFDRSGFDDLAVAVGINRTAGVRNEGDPQASGDDLVVFLNQNGAVGGPFSSTPSQPPIRVGSSPEAIVVGDWNDDRQLDLATLDNGVGDITALSGDRRGHFVAKPANVTVGAVPRSLVAADFDGDRVPDLATASFGASTVSVLRGNRDRRGSGDGTFEPAVDFWAGDAPSAVAAGDFNGDGRIDLVAAGLRPDRLSLLLNDPRGRRDGVAITRDIAYPSPTHTGYDPFAAHHTLDVYVPPRGSTSLAGPGRRYPVVLFAHGGAGIAADKTAVSYLMRSLAGQGVVAVSTNYRLGPGLTEDQTADVASAFRWVHRNIGHRFGGDVGNIFLSGHSHGSGLIAKVGTEAKWQAQQRHIRGLVLTCFLGPQAPSPSQAPSVLITGTEGLDHAMSRSSAVFAAASAALGAESSALAVADRDHFTVLSRMALPRDPARERLLTFLREHVSRPRA